MPAAKATVVDVSAEKLMEDLWAVAGNAEELLKATASQTGERVAAARVKAEESLRAAKARLVEAQAELVAKAKVAAQTTDEYVRANVWKSMGVAAVVGLALGMLIARR